MLPLRISFGLRTISREVYTSSIGKLSLDPKTKEVFISRIFLSCVRLLTVNEFWTFLTINITCGSNSVKPTMERLTLELLNVIKRPAKAGKPSWMILSWSGRTFSFALAMLKTHTYLTSLDVLMFLLLSNPHLSTTTLLLNNMLIMLFTISLGKIEKLDLGVAMRSGNP